MAFSTTRSLLLAASLSLAGLIGCTKKDDVPPLTVPSLALGTGTYTMDGMAVTTTSDCTTAQDYDINKNPIDKLFVHLNINVSGKRKALTLLFTKPLNSDRSGFQMQSINYRDETVSPWSQRNYLLALRYTLTPTSDGYSGAFEAMGDAAPPDYLTSSNLTAGAFNAKL